MTKPKGPKKPKSAKPRKVIPIKPDKPAGKATLSVEIKGLKIGARSRGGVRKDRPQHGGRPPAHEQEARRVAREEILRTREAIGQTVYKSFEVMEQLRDGDIIDDADQLRIRMQAANTLLNKAGLGDTSKLEVTTDRPVTVQFGPMTGFPSPAADVNGVEPDGSVADAVDLDEDIADPEPHEDPPGA